MNTIKNLVAYIAGKKTETIKVNDPEEIARTLLMKNEEIINNWYKTK